MISTTGVTKVTRSDLETISPDNLHREELEIAARIRELESMRTLVRTVLWGKLNLYKNLAVKVDDELHILKKYPSNYEYAVTRAPLPSSE